MDNPVSEVIRRGVVVGLANHTILIDRHGGERPIEDSAAPIKDSDGRLLGVILVFHDVTVQRNAERELRKPTVARTNSWRLSLMSCETRWLRFETPWRSSSRSPQPMAERSTTPMPRWIVN